MRRVAAQRIWFSIDRTWQTVAAGGVSLDRLALMWDNRRTIDKAAMETSRGEVPPQGARAKWKPGAGYAPKIPLEPLTERHLAQ
jgi:hypothetical protein